MDHWSDLPVVLSEGDVTSPKSIKIDFTSGFIRLKKNLELVKVVGGCADPVFLRVNGKLYQPQVIWHEVEKMTLDASGNITDITLSPDIDGDCLITSFMMTTTER